MGRETSACVFLAVLVARAPLAVAEVNSAARAGVDAAVPAPAKTDASLPSPPHPTLPAALTEGIDRLVAEALAQGKLPGCVVAVGRTSGIAYQKAFGSRVIWRA